MTTDKTNEALELFKDGYEDCDEREATYVFTHEEIETIRQALASVAPLEGQAGDVDYALQTGLHTIQFAKNLGWKNDGEGAFEYVQRRSFSQGLEDQQPEKDRLIASMADAVEDYIMRSVSGMAIGSSFTRMEQALTQHKQWSQDHNKGVGEG